jgi:hypothetical protein
MIVVLFIWLIVGFVFLVTGRSAAVVAKWFSGGREANEPVSPDELFFTGFLILSALTGFLSIWFPVGSVMLTITGVIVVLLFVWDYRGFRELYADVKNKILSTGWTGLVFLAFVSILIMTAVVQKITLGDTESYHAQSIQWVRKFAVVPGLGNIHGRLAFNSMFFVISGLFTFQFNGILIYPLNGICYLVLVLRLFYLFKEQYKSGNTWLAVFYMLLILVTLFVLIPDLNSPSPDIICSILVVYAFVIILNLRTKGLKLNILQLLLLSLIIFSSISYKLSSLFFVCVTVLFLDTDFRKRIFILAGAGIFVISSFIVRNYYLSGYLVYPFPAIDIFSVDWKIPVNDVLAMKLEIGSWAKNSVLPAGEVSNMKMTEWIPLWFSGLSSTGKVLVAVNLFLLASFIIMLIKRDLFISMVHLIILVNLFFWFIMAPDPRFAYGFLFLGFALAISCLVRISGTGIVKYIRYSFAFFIFLVLFRRVVYLESTIANPSVLLIPAPFGTVETNEYNAGFKYRVPVPGGGCFNTEIPCVPYQLSNIVMRGDDLQDGFKNYPYPNLPPKGKE